MWTYAHICRRRQQEYERTVNNVKLVCSFIDPEKARQVFTEGEKVESTGFLDDIKAMDPNFNPSEYEDILENI